MRSFAVVTFCRSKNSSARSFSASSKSPKRLEPIARNRRNSDLLKEKTLVTAFYQPSTRTRLAHEAAMHRLGGHVTGFSDAKMTRAGDWYQESIKDTVKMLEFYGDVIVMRHFQQGAPQEAAKWAQRADHQRRRRLGRAPDPDPDRPLHGAAGEGPHRRPEVAGRRRHAHAHDALAGLCPDAVRLPDHVRRPARYVPDCHEFKDELRQYSLNFREAEHVEQAIAEADVILVEPVVQPDYTKCRDERRQGSGLTPANYRITRELLATKAKIRRDPAALAAAHGRNPRPTWTSPAGRATGRRRSTAS